MNGFYSPDFCKKCRYCCKFYYSEIWEVPTALQKNLITDNKNNLLICPLLTEDGCKLSPYERPLDCLFYPFRIMEKNNEKVLAASTDCLFIKELIKKDSLREFVQDKNILLQILEKKLNTFPYTDSYTVIQKI